MSVYLFIAHLRNDEAIGEHTPRPMRVVAETEDSARNKALNYIFLKRLECSKLELQDVQTEASKT